MTIVFAAHRRKHLFTLSRPVYVREASGWTPTGEHQSLEIHYWGESVEEAYRAFLRDYGDEGDEPPVYDGPEFLRFAIDTFPFLIHTPATALADVHFQGHAIEKWLHAVMQRAKMPPGQEHDTYQLRRRIAKGLAKSILDLSVRDLDELLHSSPPPADNYPTIEDWEEWRHMDEEEDE